MCKKAQTYLQKLSMVMACARESLDLELLLYKVTPVDVKAAWAIIRLSIETYKNFKVCHMISIYFLFIL